MEEKITVIEKDDLGPVIARADHIDQAIEVNKKIFYKLPPMVQEFVLCHEVCHLTYQEWDEDRTHRLASRVFLDRAGSPDDLSKRREFLSYMEGRDYSNLLSVASVVGIITGAVGLGTSVFGIIRQRNAGWYSWDSSTQRDNLNVMLQQAFEGSRKSSKRSASEIFWEIMYQYDNKDNDLDKFLGRSSNSWVNAVIAGFERKYGFGFREVTPIDLSAFPAVKILAGAAAAVAVALVIRQIIKQK